MAAVGADHFRVRIADVADVMEKRGDHHLVGFAAGFRQQADLHGVLELGDILAIMLSAMAGEQILDFGDDFVGGEAGRGHERGNG